MSCPSELPSPPPLPPPSQGSSVGGIFSKISKTFEHKFNEIKNESSPEKQPIDHKSTIDLNKSIDHGAVKPTSISLSNSPSKKSNLVQDFSDFRSELGRGIPKLSELRNRKSTNKDNRSRSSFTLNSILGRDEGVSLDDLLPEEDGLIEAGVEAEEGILYSSPESGSVSYTANSDRCDDNDRSLSNDPLRRASTPQQSDDIKEDVSQKTHLPPLPSSSSPETFHGKIFSKLHSFYKQYGYATKSISILILICFILPLPAFLSGTIFGGSVVGLISFLVFKVLVPTETTPRRALRTHRPILLDLMTDDDHQHYKVRLAPLIYKENSLVVTTHGNAYTQRTV